MKMQMSPRTLTNQWGEEEIPMENGKHFELNDDEKMRFKHVSYS